MSRANNMKLAALPPGVSRFSPAGVADLIDHLRGVSAGGTSRAEKLVNWAQPGLNAAHGVHGDYMLIHDALKKAVPGSEKFFSKKIRRGAHALADLAEESVRKHGPGALESAGSAIDALRQRLAGPQKSAPWYHDPASAVGAGLGVAGLAGLGAVGTKRLLDQHQREQMDSEQSYPMDTALNKISTALDLLADELDTRPVAAPEEKLAEDADVFGNFYEFYKHQVGEEPPAALVEKLAQDADEETVDALKKLVKSAALERPTPLGEPSEGGGYREPPTNRGDVAKMAWEQFEETLLNYEGA